MLIVDILGNGDYTTISEAINSIPEGKSETIYVKRGVYHEVLELKKDNITIKGEDKDSVIINYNNYANMIMEDGTKRGTFRSYTFLITSNNVTLENLTIENTSGYGQIYGQAVALYVNGDNFTCNNCNLYGRQDTLFTGPLPKKEKQPGGFTGPTKDLPKYVNRQLYSHCRIAGDVDFIFGSAIAYFEECDIICLNRGNNINGFVTAPSTYEGCKYGYVFKDCKIRSNCPKESFYLGRPWRIYAKAVFIDCEIEGHIKKEGFHDWNKPESHETSFFAEYNCVGDGADTSDRASFCHVLSDDEAKSYTKELVLNYKFED